MKLNWLYFLGFYLMTIGLISNSFNSGFVGKTDAVSPTSLEESLTIQGDQIGVNFSDEARMGRTQVSLFPRQKVDRADKFESFGLEFLSCKLSRSYSETDIDKNYLQLLGRSIQVNAP
ncbi:MAG: hypothetical protein LPK25_09310 [Cyclobacteriaceae bacterium]|nr:hypothetical protein [Cyclobacteriaceae bacterium]MDX5466807.1 hypothetical protein [Cyclobacteriaceae bacterium]